MKKNASKKKRSRRRKESPRRALRDPAPSPADIAFFSNLFSSMADEMGVTLARTAYSPNIKERRDFSCAVFNGQGQLIAQAAHIPVHLGALPMSVAAVLRTVRAFRDGDAIILNDPYDGGTHLPDITMVTPVMIDPRRQPFAFLVTRAHHADVGGAAPGSMPLASDIYQEGLRLSPVKLYRGGKLNVALMETIKANVRTPDERAGDLRAQRSAHAVGALRMQEAVARYGAAQLLRQQVSLLDYGKRVMQSVIRKIPDGVYRFEDVLDDDGLGPDPIRIRVCIRIKDRTAEVDFAGSARSCRGSLNAVEAVTRAAVYYGFLCLLATPSDLMEEAFSTPPFNAGCLEPIRVIAPKGSIVNASEPSAVAGGNVETSQRIVDVVFGALGKALPNLIPAASQGTMNNLTLGGTDPRTGKRFAYYETIAGGMGARPDGPGVDGVQAHMTNTLNTPIEALEYAYPMRVERYSLVPGTGGQGRHAGGCGIQRDVRMLGPSEGTLLTERRTHPPYGLRGGQPGACGQNTLIRNGKKRKLPGKVRLELQAGDVISIRTPGGGGWGRAK